MVSSAGGLPMRMAIACSNWARATVDVGVLHARGVELSFGLGYVGFGSYAAEETIAGELQGVGEALTVSSRSCFWASALRSSK